MKKISLMLLLAAVLLPLNVFALKATTLFEFKGIGGNTYQITLSLNNAEDVVEYSTTIVLPEGASVNSDVSCGDGSSCTITDNVLTVTNDNGLSGEICKFTVEAAEKVLDMSFSDSKVADASGNSKNIYNPSTESAYSNNGNPSTGIIGALSLTMILVAVSMILIKIIKKNRFQNI